LSCRAKASLLGSAGRHSWPVGFCLWRLFHVSRGSDPTPLTGKAPGGAPAGPSAGFAPPVETARVIAANLAPDTTAVGSLRSNESVVLRPETAGRISSINFKDGSTVSKGGLLVGFDSATQSAEFDQAKANLGLTRSYRLIKDRFLGEEKIKAIKDKLAAKKGDRVSSGYRSAAAQSFRHCFSCCARSYDNNGKRNGRPSGKPSMTVLAELQKLRSLQLRPRRLALLR